MGLFFNRENPKTILDGINRAQQILDERFEKKQVSLEIYQKQTMAFNKQRIKYEKKVK